MIGYDLDGVIANEPFYLPLVFKINVKIGIQLRYFQKVLYFPIKKGIIITGRPEEDREITEKWLTNNKVEYNTLLMSPTFSFDEIIKFKKEAINTLNITHYIESDIKIINLLYQECRNCSFFLPDTAGNFIQKRR